METYDYDDRLKLVTVRSLINKDINDAETKEELLEILEEAKQKRLIQIFKNVKDIKPRLALKVGSYVKYTKLPSEIGNLTQLTKLFLSDNQLQNLPESIGNLTQLIELDLGDNQLQNLPESIGNLTQLTKLDLTLNQLQNLPASIGKLTKLTELFLGGNQLQNLPESIGNLTQLTHLGNELYLGYLGGNQLQNLPESIGNLTKLTMLGFSINQLQNLPESIGNLTKLTKLFLSDNQLQNLPESIGNLTQLIELYLGNNQLQNLPESIGNLTQLIELDLGDNQLQNLPESIGNLTKLTYLGLGINQLQNLPESIGNLTQLIELNLTLIQLQNLPESIGNLTKLTYLRLGKNQLQNLPESIGNLTKLTHLGLDENQLQNLPESIGNLTQLTKLNLTLNQLQNLPRSFQNLVNLEEVNLSRNLLTVYPEVLDVLEDNHNLDEIRIENNPFNRNVQRQQQPQGVAFEVHNAFDAIDIPFFLNVITQAIGRDTPSIDITQKYSESVPNHELKNFAYSVLTKLINELSGDTEEQIQQLQESLRSKLDEIFEKIKPVILDEQEQLVISSILQIILLADHKPLNNYYAEEFVNSCVHAYDSGDGMSCVKGILERFLLVFLSGVRVTCCNEEGCNNQYLLPLCAYAKYSDLTSSSLNSVIQEWAMSGADEDKWNSQTERQRKDAFVNYIVEFFTQGVDNEFIREKYKERVNQLISKEPHNLYNFKCSEPSEAIINAEDCEQEVGGGDQSGSGRRRTKRARGRTKKRKTKKKKNSKKRKRTSKNKGSKSTRMKQQRKPQTKRLKNIKKKNRKKYTRKEIDRILK